MATELTFKSLGGGRIPSLQSAGKVPGPGLKFKMGRLTVGTAEYPTSGWVAADLETLFGFTHIECIIPCGVLKVDASNTAGFIVSWNGVARTLQVYGNLDADTGNATAGADAAVIELAQNDASIDAGTVDIVVIGY